MPVVNVRCLALKCQRNPRGFRFRGYIKCFGCHAAIVKEHGHSKFYNGNNFNLQELREKAKRRRQ